MSAAAARRPSRLLLATLALVFAPGAAAAPRLTVVAPPALAAVADEVRRLGDGDLQAVLEATGVAEVEPPIRVVLIAESDELARRTPDWVCGLASGRDSTVLLFPGRLRSYPDTDLRSLLHHEVTHVLAERASRGRPLPRWFHEGVATVAARQWGLEDRARFTLAVLGGRPLTTRDLDRGFSGSRAEVARSYALSAGLVRSLRRRFGPDLSARVLSGVGAGLRFEEAFRRASGSSFEAVERELLGRELVWSAWVPFLTSTTALWMGITLLALYAIRRRLQRSAELRARWEEEESPDVVN